jgi:hypothetical protein
MKQMMSTPVSQIISRIATLERQVRVFRIGVAVAFAGELVVEAK